MMGVGVPPNLGQILSMSYDKDIKINIVLGPENTQGTHIYDMICKFDELIERLEFGGLDVNLREPYGQPHVGNPFEKLLPVGYLYGMPQYRFENVIVTYWDVHYVEVESVNLYANGVISTDYPITRGHDPIYGQVLDQSHFLKSGRQQEQWLT
jgi:hypothetical protein